jgi:hypothetical protein
MTVIINGSTGIDTIQDSIVTDSKLSLSANSQEIKDALNATGSAPIYSCRAWVNFNGTGTVAIRGSGNVSSITDNGTGDYTVNFTTAMSDANYGYACSASIRDATSNNVMLIVGGDRDVAPTSSALRINTIYNNSGANTSIDAGEVCVSIFR